MQHRLIFLLKLNVSLLNMEPYCPGPCKCEGSRPPPWAGAGAEPESRDSWSSQDTETLTDTGLTWPAVPGESCLRKHIQPKVVKKQTK